MSRRPNLEMVEMADRLRQRSLFGLLELWAFGFILLMAAPALAQNDDDQFPRADLIIHLNQPPTWTDSSMANSLPTHEELRGVAIDPALLETVKQLEDPAFAVREQANRKLLEANPDKMQLYALLAGEAVELTAEQRYRLLTALRQHLLHTPRGALGISMQQIPVNFGGPNGWAAVEIRVTDLLPGLPAEQVLKIGDRIAEIDHQPLASQQELLSRVQSKKPGESVALTIKRPKLDDQGRPLIDANNLPVTETMEVELTLGSAELLREFNQIRANQANQVFIQDQSPVERARQDEANAAARQLGPPARTIPLHEHSKLGTAAAAIETGAASADVDRDPIILNLLAQRSLMSQGRLNARELQLLREQWRQTLMELDSRAQLRHISRAEQDYLRDLINRAIELMQAPLE